MMQLKHMEDKGKKSQNTIVKAIAYREKWSGWLKTSGSSSVQFSPVAQSCPTLCDPTNRSTPGLLVHHHSRSPPKLMSTESMMPSNHLILCHPLLLLPSIFPSIRIFSSESVLLIRWPEYWSFTFSISPSNEYLGLVTFRIDCLISLQPKGLWRGFSSTTVLKHQFLSS